MEDARELEGHAHVKGPQGEVVVDVVKHAVGGDDLGGDLAKLDRKKNHGKASSKEEGVGPPGEPRELNAVDGGTAELNGKDDEDDEELTAHEVAVEVVALVCE